MIDTESRKVSLKDIKSKVILLNFTGIGCGACQEAVPYLKELKNKYPSETFELVAIESWSGRTSLQKDYAKGKGLNYMLLGANEEVLKDYQTGRSAPWFFILDKKRIIRKVFRGYSQERTGTEMGQRKIDPKSRLSNSKNNEEILNFQKLTKKNKLTYCGNKRKIKKS